MIHVVPPVIPGTYSLSGGLSAVKTTESLHLLHRIPDAEKTTSNLNFTHRRALQTPVLKTLDGDDDLTPSYLVRTRRPASLPARGEPARRVYKTMIEKVRKAS